PAGFGGTWDDGLPGVPVRLTPAQEQGTGLASLTAFFRSYLGHETEFRAFLRGDAPPPDSAQVAADQLFVSYQAPDNVLFRRDINTLLTSDNVTTNTLGGNVIQSGLSTYKVSGGVGPDFELNELQLAYGGTLEAYYENDIPEGARDESGYD